VAQNRLTLGEIRKKKQPGYYADGGGLYLRVLPSKTMLFLVRYTADGGRKEVTLGQFPTLGLADARKLAKQELKRLKSAATDAAADATEAPKKAKPKITFADCAEKYIKAHKAEWSERHHAGWVQTMHDYAGPVIGRAHPSEVNTEHMRIILEPIWETKTETAVRVRSRIEAILDWAAVMGHRSADKPNPARWKGHLQHVFADRNKVAPVKHREALPFRDIPDFIAKLRTSTDFAAKALLFTILTAARSGEARGATWGEMDLTAAEWVIPAARMKASKEHRVPLAPEVLALIGERPHQAGAKDYVFPSVRTGHRNGALISSMSLQSMLKNMGYQTLTTHGFRSTFRDWAAETTDYANEVVEMALAHAIGSKVEAAYRRGNLLEKRRMLMKDWTLYCLSANVNAQSQPD